MEFESKTVNILLKRGVIVPIKVPLFLRLFNRKKQLQVQLPTVEVLVHIADLWLSINQKLNKELTLNDAFKIVSEHSVTVSKIIAWTIVNNPKKSWQIPLVAKCLRKLPANELMQLYQIVVLYGGLEDFINTIRLVENTRITAPMNLSHEDEMS